MRLQGCWFQGFWLQGFWLLIVHLSDGYETGATNTLKPETLKSETLIPHIYFMQEIIESAWNDRSLLQNWEIKKAIREVIAALDAGELRVAEPSPGEGGWITHDWIKKAILLYAKWLYLLDLGLLSDIYLFSINNTILYYSNKIYSCFFF